MSQQPETPERDTPPPAKVEINIGGRTVTPEAVADLRRQFRGAWQMDGDVVAVDMAAARDLHRKYLRRERAPRWPALDAAWFRAAEQNDTPRLAQVAAEKQALRDVTEDARIDAANTPEDLAALTLDALLA